MMLNAQLIRRSLARLTVALLPVALAGCTFLFPQRPLSSGGTSGPADAGSTTATAGVSSGPYKPNASLYVRLGGDAGLNAFTDDFLGRVTNDPKIIPFFKGLTQADLTRVRLHVFELLCSATGGPCTYTGKDMKTTHKEMEINNDSWNAFTGHLNETVSRFRIQDRERNELVVIIASLKGDIVNR